jgi:alkanesulfonate monooxygenase
MIILGVNAGALGGHLGGWRHRDAFATSAMQLKNAIEIARIAERGKMDFMFLADGNGVRQMDKPELFAANSPSDRPAVFEPVTLFSAVAQYTEHLGFVATATTTYEEPFTIARKFASLDHLSGGRAAWNVVTTSYAEDALNFSHTEHVARELRYERAREAVDVVKGLWNSWGDDAFVQDKASGQYLDPRKVKALNHVGKHFSVRGPLNVARTPQGHPVIFSAGQSDAGRELAAYSSEALFGTATGKEEAQALYADIKGRMKNYGRDEDELRILPACGVFAARTMAEAEKVFDELQALISPALGVPYLSKLVGMDLKGFPIDGPMPQDLVQQVGGTAGGRSIQEMAWREGLTIRQTYERILGSQAGNVMKGDAKHIADIMEDWYRGKACDGFILQIPIMPRLLENFVDLVVPELQRRGLFRTEYEGTTLRDNLRLKRPADPFQGAQA